MKTASKHPFLVKPYVGMFHLIAFAVMAFLFWVFPAQAQSTMPPVAVESAPPVGAPKISAPALGEPTPGSVAKSIEPPSPPKTIVPELKEVEKGKGTLSETEEKVSDSVRDVVRHLGTAENITIDDLNSARQVVARIEALIDVEKHMAELEKLRSEREGVKSLASAIPASALRAPTQYVAPPVSPPPVTNAAVNVMPNFEPEVSRIVGSDGHYTAMIKMPDGQTKQIKVGDRLSNGSKVLAIGASGIEVDQNGTQHTFNVKNVDTVFGGSL
jgi:type IV pilus biogenesis protein PilP